jgi:hypothetical protein
VSLTEKPISQNSSQKLSRAVMTAGVLNTYEKFIVDCVTGEHPIQSNYGKLTLAPEAGKDSGESVI